MKDKESQKKSTTKKKKTATKKPDAVKNDAESEEITEIVKPPEFKNKAEFFKLLGYVPFEAQQKFHDSEARFKVLIAGSRFGKSLAAAYEAAYLMLKPKTRGWIVAPTYLLGEKEFRYLYEIFIELLPKAVPGLDAKAIAKKSSYSVRGGNMKIVLPWGAEVSVRSADRAYTLLGEELDWLILSEAAQLKHDIWGRYLRARLVNRKGCMISPSTPAGKNWLYLLFLRGLNPDFPDWESWQYASIENPHIETKEIDDAKRILPADIFAEQFLGDFVTKIGAVYAEFSRALHVRDLSCYLPAEFPLCPKFRYFRSFDFGFTNATAVIFAALLDDDILYIYDEYYERQRTNQEIIQAVLDKSKGIRFEFSTADPAAARERNEFLSADIGLIKAPNEIRWGINSVRERLMLTAKSQLMMSLQSRNRKNVESAKIVDSGELKNLKDSDAENFAKPANLPDSSANVNCRHLPRLIIHPRCRHLIYEFEHYKYPEPTPESPYPEHPIKVNDHALDALRYLVSALKKQSQTTWHLLENRR